MAAAKKKKIPAETGVTPRATSGYGEFIYKADTKFDAKGKFKLTLELDPKNPEHKAFIDQRIARHKEFSNGDLEICPVKPGNTEWKQDPDLMYATFKTGRAPKVVDSQKNDITSSEVRVFGGDTVRVAWTDNPIDTGAFKGCFLYLNKVMLVEKNGTVGADFEAEEEGYVADQREQASNYEPKGGDADETAAASTDGDF